MTAHLAETLEKADKLGRRMVISETGLPEGKFPTQNPYGMDDIMTRKFSPPKDRDPR